MTVLGGIQTSSWEQIGENTRSSNRAELLAQNTDKIRQTRGRILAYRQHPAAYSTRVLATCEICEAGFPPRNTVGEYGNVPTNCHRLPMLGHSYRWGTCSKLPHCEHHRWR